MFVIIFQCVFVFEWSSFSSGSSFSSAIFVFEWVFVFGSSAFLGVFVTSELGGKNILCLHKRKRFRLDGSRLEFYVSKELKTSTQVRCYGEIFRFKPFT